MEGHTQVTVWLEDSIKAAMDAVKESKGIPVSAQIRFGSLMWLETQGENPLALKKPRAPNIR